MIKNTFFNSKVKIEIKTTRTTVTEKAKILKGNTYIAEPNLEITLNIIQ